LTTQQGEEVLHLPTIVEAAESSPQAAQVAAKQIRKFLSKENNERPHVQYNAIMLIRILADNPGATFTRHMDGKFTSTVKELLRNGRDPSVQQILRETLAALYTDKAYDTNLTTLFAMWNKEQGGTSPRPQNNGASSWPQVPAVFANNQSNNNNNNNHHQSSRNQPRQHVPGQENYQRSHREHGLPPPAELAARIEEAKTSAKLLQQLVQSTPPSELQDNDLIKEFSERCQTAQRSVQGYINSTNPSPDDDTMQTLIETSEQLSLAASKHQRAVLQARRAVASVSPPAQTAYAPPMGPSMGQNTGYSSPTSPPSSTYIPTIAPQLEAYSPPPVPPPSMRANLERRQSEYDIPPSLQPGGTPSPPAVAPPSMRAPQIPAPAASVPLELPAPQYDNPFSDRHESQPQPSASAYAINENPRPLSRITEPQSPSTRSEYDEYDDPYHAPTPISSTVASVGTRPAPRQQDTVENWRREIGTSSPPRREGEPYHPGYQATPSYMHRQESSEAHLTMHGGAVPPTPTPGYDAEKELGSLHQMNLSPVAEVRSPVEGEELIGPAARARAAVAHANAKSDAGRSDGAISPVFPDRHSGEVSPVSAAPGVVGEGRYGSAGSPGRYSSAYGGKTGEQRGEYRY
jgi:hypothetical protein